MAWAFLLFLASAGAWAETPPTPSLPLVEEREFPLRRGGFLLVANPRGPVRVRGWALDRLRVRLVKRVAGATPEARKAGADRVGVALDEMKGGWHLGVRTGVGLTLEERLKDRASQDTIVELEIRAPAHAPLQVTGSPEVLVRDWASSVEVRARRGEVAIEDSSVSDVSVLCAECRIEVARVKGKRLRAVGTAGEIAVLGSRFGDAYLETTEGPLSFREGTADELWISTRTGALTLADATANIEFQTAGGSVIGERLRGAASGRVTGAGSIRLEFSQWAPRDRVLLESDQGDISLRLPGDVGVDVELGSGEKTVSSEFEIRSPPTPVPYGPAPARDRDWRGRIGKGGSFLQVRSRAGDVRLEKAPAKGAP